MSKKILPRVILKLKIVLFRWSYPFSVILIQKNSREIGKKIYFGKSFKYEGLFNQILERWSESHSENLYFYTIFDEESIGEVINE